MQLKKRTSKPVPPPAKICSFLFGRSGFGLIGIMVAIVATGLLVVPLTRWYISMTSGAEGLQDKLAMQTIIQDHWLTLNDEGFDELSAAIATKGTTWTENVGEGGRYTITTSFGDAGKYVNAACTDGAPGTDERECRKVSVQIRDNVTGQTQALNLTKVASQTDKRLKDLEARSASLEGRVAQEEAWTSNLNARVAQEEAWSGNFNARIAQEEAWSANFNSRISANESRWGQYYTAAQVDQKVTSSGFGAQLEIAHSACGAYTYNIYTGANCQLKYVCYYPGYESQSYCWNYVPVHSTTGDTYNYIMGYQCDSSGREYLPIQTSVYEDCSGG